MDSDDRNPDDLRRNVPDSFTHDEHVEIWDLLGDIPAEAPNSAAMRSRLDAALAAEVGARPTLTQRPARSSWRFGFAAGKGPHHMVWALAAAAVAVLAVGVVIGRATIQAPQPDSSIAALRQELRETRQMVALSLLQQQSASDRIKGVNWSYQLQQPSGEVLSALLDTLMHDPSVNVRLATVEALRQFGNEPVVRRGLVQAIAHEESPMVQVALIDLAVDLREKESIGTLRQLVTDQNLNGSVRQSAERGLEELE